MKKNDLNLWLGLAVSPLILTYLGLKSANDWLIEVGRASEEVFRGDRLPILNFPATTTPEKE